MTLFQPTVLVARMSNQPGSTALVAIMVADTGASTFETRMYFRDLGATTNRWTQAPIPAAFWPEQGPAKRTGWIGTSQGHIGRALADSGEITIEGWWTLEATPDDLATIEAKGRPTNLLAAVEAAATGVAASSKRLPNMLAAMTSIADGPLIPLAHGDSLTSWTESVLTRKVNITLPTAAEGQATLPDGTPYIDRTFMVVEGVPLSEVEYVRLLASRRETPLLVGPGGTGKTSLVLAAVGDYQITSCNREMTTLSLYGRYEPDPDNPGAFRFVESALIKSLLANDGEGMPWYCDEMMQMPEEVQTVLHPLLDDRRELIIEEGPLVAKYGGRIKAGPKWCAIFASNPNEPGSTIARPIASRLIPIRHETNFRVVEKIIGPGHELLIMLAESMNLRMTNGEVEWAPQTRHLKQTVAAMSFLGVRYGLERLLSSCHAETGFVPSYSYEVQELQRMISETFGLHGLQPLAIR